MISFEEVQNGLKQDEFVPHFQPMVLLSTGELAGFEMLARWNHPVRGLITPDQFIPSAEREGWIDELMRRLLAKTFRAARLFPETLTVSVNISPVQLRNASLPEQIEALARYAGFPLNRMVIELTETALAENLDLARTVAVRLKELGCRLALDDFGTGYSSLLHLQALPLDELKVDRSFVLSMTERRESRKIVAAVIGLGQSLGLTTVAEGVETQEQAQMLRWLGCDVVQGWLYGPPASDEDVADRLAVRRPSFSLPSESPAGNCFSKHLEALPAQRLAQLEAIYDGAPVGLAFLDRNLRYVNLNRRFAELTGRSITDHLGKTPREMMPELFPFFGSCPERALKGEEVSGLEIHDPGSATRPAKTYLASWQPARDEAGEIIGISVAILDFTERRMAQDRLQEFELIVESLEEMIVVVDQDYRFVLANRAFLKNLNVSAEQLIGTSVPGPVDREIYQQIIRPKLEDCFRGSRVEYEMAYRFPGGGERELLVSYSPIEVCGITRAAACVIRDVTELKRMKRMEMSWKRRLHLAEPVGLRIGLWDWKSNANTWSDEVYRQMGIGPEPLYGRPPKAFDRVHPQDRSLDQGAAQGGLLCREQKADGVVPGLVQKASRDSVSSPLKGIPVDISPMAKSDA